MSTDKKPSVVVATITAGRRLGEHSAAIPHRLDYDGPLSYIVNVEFTPQDYTEHVQDQYETLVQDVRDAWGDRGKVENWCMESDWRSRPQFDQDQARLWGICAGRNFCRDFAMSQDADVLLFLDSDVRVPTDSIPKLLEVMYYKDTLRHYVVGGMVPGRGVHQEGVYAFWLDGVSHVMVPHSAAHVVTGLPVPVTDIVELVRVQHATMGFVAMHKTVFNWLPFTWVAATCGEYTDPSGVQPGALSEDPHFGIMAKRLWGKPGTWVLRTDLKAEHLGPLNNAEVAQF